jgi:C4-dicarboxylate-specific signal transduction histidine kinase
MSNDWELIGRTGLAFFGKMTASISHEIKNVLAIINENAGLLEDITLMAERGIPINLDRLKTQAERIKNQIRRADVIVKNMNRFAHSVDESLMSVDLAELLEFLAALSRRSQQTFFCWKISSGYAWISPWRWPGLGKRSVSS